MCVNWPVLSCTVCLDDFVNIPTFTTVSKSMFFNLYEGLNWENRLKQEKDFFIQNYKNMK